MLALLTAAVLAGAPSAALDQARAYLEKNQLDEVLFALQGVQLEGAQKARGAEILARAAQQSLSAKDDLMALQLAQMALQHQAGHATGLEVAARASLAQQQFDAAERYADGWIKAAPRSAPAAIFRAQLAQGQAEPQAALDVLAGVDTSPLPPDQKAAVEGLRQQADARLKEQAARRAELQQLEAEVARGGEQGRQQAARAPAPARPAAGGPKVILYSTAWCGYCTRARAYLNAKGVAFEEKDIEKDPAGARELQQKRARAGIRSRGVPVIDVRGTLVLGFDQPRLDALLR